MSEVVREEKPFPDDLEGRLSAVANAVNMEFKTITLLHLDDIPASGNEIRRRIRETRGRGYLPDVRLFGAYGNTLHDIALVAKQTVIRDEGDIQEIGYELTEAGRVYGIPIASLALKYAIDNGISFYSILGQTLSRRESRAPYNRIRILEELKEGVKREVDLSNALNLRNSSTQEHLLKLSKINFIRFDSIGANPKGKCTFSLVDGEDIDNAEHYPKYPLPTDRVITSIKIMGKEFNSHMLARDMGYKHLSHVSSILCFLEKQGYVKRDSIWKSRKIESEAELLDNGKRYLDEFVIPTREHLTYRNSKGVNFGESFGEYVGRGVELYRKISPGVNRKDPVERIKEIRNYLLGHGGVTAKELAKVFKLSVMSITNYLSKLDDVRSEKEGHEVKYFLEREG